MTTTTSIKRKKDLVVKMNSIKPEFLLRPFPTSIQFFFSRWRTLEALAIPFIRITWNLPIISFLYCSIRQGDTQCDFDADDTTRSSTGGVAETLDFDAASEMLSSAAVNSKKPAECVCPNCQRNMAASRFAPHLEKCMGMGRNSSRLASRRIATSASRQVCRRHASKDDNHRHIS